jgi:hypothetical protein
MPAGNSMLGTETHLTDADDADAVTTLGCQQASHPKTGSGPQHTTRHQPPDQPNPLSSPPEALSVTAGD